MLRKFDRDISQMPSLALRGLPEGIQAMGERAPCEIELLSYKLFLDDVRIPTDEIGRDLQQIIIKTQMWTHNYLWQRGQDYEIDITCIEPEQKNKIIIRKAIDPDHALWVALVAYWTHIGVCEQPLTIESLKAIDASQQFGGANG